MPSVVMTGDMPPGWWLTAHEGDDCPDRPHATARGFGTGYALQFCTRCGYFRWATRPYPTGAS